MAAEVRDESFEGATRDLVGKAAEKFGWDSTLARPLRRFGYSGARVLVIREEENIDPPYVLKIAEQCEIAVETRAIDWCEPSLDMPKIHEFLSSVEEDEKQWGAISYRFYKVDGPEPVDLTGRYASCMNSLEDSLPNRFEDTLSGSLSQALGRIERGRRLLARQTQPTYLAMFEQYLRRDKPERIDRVDQVMRGRESFTAHGWTISGNPLNILDDLLKDKSNGFQARLIHGDLHLSNIVIDGSSGSNLIDFKWAHRGGHLLIDYALLESSVRFATLPHDIHPAIVFDGDRELNEDADGGRAGSLIGGLTHDLSRHRLQEMLNAVLFIRGFLRKTQPSWDERMWKEYQRTLYLLLSGQQRLTTFPLMRSIVNLHQLRQVLER